MLLQGFVPGHGGNAFPRIPAAPGKVGSTPLIPKKTPLRGNVGIWGAVPHGMPFGIGLQELFGRGGSSEFPSQSGTGNPKREPGLKNHGKKQPKQIPERFIPGATNIHQPQILQIQPSGNKRFPQIPSQQIFPGVSPPIFPKPEPQRGLQLDPRSWIPTAGIFGSSRTGLDPIPRIQPGFQPALGGFSCFPS